MHQTPFDMLQSMQSLYTKSQLHEASQGFYGIVYRVGEKPFLSPMSMIQEILPFEPLQALPGVQPWVKGVFDSRGQLFVVNDLAQFLFQSDTALNSRSKILVVEKKREYVGFVVEQVDTMVRVQKHQQSTASNQAIPFVEHQIELDGRYVPYMALTDLMDSPAFLQATKVVA